MCVEESKITDLCHNMKDLFKIFSNSNAHTNKFLQNSLFKPITQDFTTAVWNPNKRLVCFGATSPLYSHEALETLLKEDKYFWDEFVANLFDGWLSFLPGAVKQYFVNEDDWSVVEISVQIYDISWLNGHASDFMQIMASKGTQKMFTYELFDALLYEQYYTIHLMTPFLIYLVMILLQFIHYIYILPSFDN